MNRWNHIDPLLSIFFLYVLEKMNINFQRSGGILKHVANQFTRFGTCRKRIYVLLAHVSRKEFTHFVRKVFARKSLPTGKLRLFRSLVPSTPQVLSGICYQETKPNCLMKTSCDWFRNVVRHSISPHDNSLCGCGLGCFRKPLF